MDKVCFFFNSHFYMCKNWSHEVKFLLQGLAMGMWPSKERLPGSVLSNSLVPTMHILPHMWALRKMVILCRMLCWHFTLFPCNPWLQHSWECFSAFWSIDLQSIPFQMLPHTHFYLAHFSLRHDAIQSSQFVLAQLMYRFALLYCSYQGYC